MEDGVFGVNFGDFFWFCEIIINSFGIITVKLLELVLKVSCAFTGSCELLDHFGFCGSSQNEARDKQVKKKSGKLLQKTQKKQLVYVPTAFKIKLQDLHVKLPSIKLYSINLMGVLVYIIF